MNQNTVSNIVTRSEAQNFQQYETKYSNDNNKIENINTKAKMVVSKMRKNDKRSNGFEEKAMVRIFRYLTRIIDPNQKDSSADLRCELLFCCLG